MTDSHMPSKAAAVHEKIRLSGERELSRDFMALMWSAIAAGITMSTSLIGRAVLHAYLPESGVGTLIECMGYTIGFIIVIMANQQLFTENTVTPVLPFMSHPTLKNLGRLMRIWGVVLVGNLIGATIAAAIMAYLPVFKAPVHAAYMTIGEHMMSNTPWQMFTKGLLAGWLIATLVWVLSSIETGKPAMIFLITYLIGIADFTHIIVGAIEAIYMVMNGVETMSRVIFHFGLPTLMGNLLGGVCIFALISHAQVRSDMELIERRRRQQ